MKKIKLVFLLVLITMLFGCSSEYDKLLDRDRYNVKETSKEVMVTKVDNSEFSEAEMDAIYEAIECDYITLDAKTIVKYKD